MNNKHIGYKRVIEVSLADYHKSQLANGDLQRNLHVTSIHSLAMAKSMSRASRPVTDTVLMLRDQYSFVAGNRITEVRHAESPTGRLYDDYANKAGAMGQAANQWD